MAKLMDGLIEREAKTNNKNRTDLTCTLPSDLLHFLTFSTMIRQSALENGGGGYDKGVEKEEQLSNNTFTLLESKRQVRETRMHHGKSIPYYKQTSLMMDDQYTKNSTTLNT